MGELLVLAGYLALVRWSWSRWRSALRARCFGMARAWCEHSGPAEAIRRIYDEDTGILGDWPEFAEGLRAEAAEHVRQHWREWERAPWRQ